MSNTMIEEKKTFKAVSYFFKKRTHQLTDVSNMM